MADPQQSVVHDPANGAATHPPRQSPPAATQHVDLGGSPQASPTSEAVGRQDESKSNVPQGKQDENLTPNLSPPDKDAPTLPMPLEDDAETRSNEDSSSGADVAATAHPPHHTSPSRTRTLSIIDSKAASSASLNPRLTNLRSRADWKQASRQLPRLEASDDASAAAVPITSPIDASDDELRGTLSSPKGSTGRLGPLAAVDAPLDLPPPIPPHSYTFIPHLAGAPQLPGLQQPPTTPSGVTYVAHPIAPRPPQPAQPAPSTSSVSPTRPTFNAHSLPRPHVCQICTLAFARGHDLKRHTATHTGEKKFKCPSCGRAYGRKDALKRHACASGTSQAVFAVNATSASTLESQNGVGVAGSSRTVTDPSAGRSRGQLHAPPIVGAAAMMMGSRPQRPIKYKNSTPKDYVRPEEDPRGEKDELEEDEAEGGANEEEIPDAEAPKQPSPPASKPSPPRDAAMHAGSEPEAEDEDEDGDGD